MKPIKVEKYQEKLYRTCIKGGTWGDIWGKWDVILHQFGEEVKGECLKEIGCGVCCDGCCIIYRTLKSVINSIRQNVIIK